MLNSLNLIYKSFYDKVFLKNYIKEGKGSGRLALGILALISSLIFSLYIVIGIRPYMSTENIDNIINDIHKNLPQIAIQNGELVWEDNTINEFTFGKDQFTIIVDTRYKAPTINEIKEAHIYITKTGLHIYNPQRNEIKDLDLKDINTLANSSYVDITSQKTLHFIGDIAKRIFDITMIIFIVVSFIIYWLANIILANITRSIMKSSDKQDIGTLDRASVAGIIPAIIVLDLLNIFFNKPGFIISWIAIVAFGVYMGKKYINQEQEEEKIEKSSTIE